MFFLTAVEEIPVIQKTWNLTDWLIVQLNADPVFSVVLNVLGALLCMLVPYLMGSINTAVILTKKMHGVDIRDYGNGDADVFNMLRASCQKKAVVITLLCDLVKASAAVWLGRLIWEVNGAALAGFFVIFGHMFPIFFRFRGGKGVECLAMVVLTLSPLTFVFLLLIFAACAVASRMVSFAAVLTALMYPLILQAFANDGLNVAMAVLTTGFIAFAYRDNLKRMQVGEEEKIDFSKWFRREKGKKDKNDE